MSSQLWGPMGFQRARALTFCIFVLPGHVLAQEGGPLDRTPPEREPSAGCGNFDYREIRGAAGPADYREASEYLIRLVENAHFTQEVEMLIRGKSGTIGGDLAYTLRVLPNHPRALKAVAAYERKLGPAAVKEMGFSTQCWFDRAVSFRSSDPNVRIIIATELIRRGQKSEAREHLVVAEQSAKSSVVTNYNLGLLYYELGDYDRSLTFAKEAYAQGFNLPGLRQKLERAGKWKD